MKAFEATYSMGDIVTGGYFRSIVIAAQEDDVCRVLNETHDEDVSNLIIYETGINASTYGFEQVVTTDYV